MTDSTICSRLFIIAASALAMSLAGCAAHRAQARAKLPSAGVVCLQIEGVTEPEKGLLTRKTTTTFVEQGYRIAAANCDLTVEFSSLDQRQWEVLEQSLLTRRSSSAYRIEGLVSVRGKDGIAVTEDQPVDLRDYESKMDLIEALAWEISTYVTYSYRP